MTTREDEQGPQEEEDTVDERDGGCDCGEAMLAHSVRKPRPILPCLPSCWHKLAPIRTTKDTVSAHVVVVRAAICACAGRVGLAHAHQAAPGKLTYLVFQPLLEAIPAPGEHALHRLLAQLSFVLFQWFLAFLGFARKFTTTPRR